ncbi:40S ribosomal protein S5-1 [Hordeum vulgare]|nr:40S ribosomal protein S5-1 [Hordeum vulgare]
MREGMLHIHDVEGPKKTGSVETRLEAMEQLVFKCQGMVERGLNANHTMITEFTSKHRIDANDIGKHLSRLYDKIDQLQAQIYDLQNQNFFQILPSSNVGAQKTGVPSAPDLCTGAKSPCLQGMEGPRQDASPKITKATTSLPCREDNQGLSKPALPGG